MLLSETHAHSRLSNCVPAILYTVILNYNTVYYWPFFAISFLLPLLCHPRLQRLPHSSTVFLLLFPPLVSVALRSPPSSDHKFICSASSNRTSPPLTVIAFLLLFIFSVLLFFAFSFSPLFTLSLSSSTSIPSSLFHRSLLFFLCSDFSALVFSSSYTSSLPPSSGESTTFTACSNRTRISPMFSTVPCVAVLERPIVLCIFSIPPVLLLVFVL